VRCRFTLLVAAATPPPPAAAPPVPPIPFLVVAARRPLAAPPRAALAGSAWVGKEGRAAGAGGARSESSRAAAFCSMFLSCTVASHWLNQHLWHTPGFAVALSQAAHMRLRVGCCCAGSSGGGGREVLFSPPRRLRFLLPRTPAAGSSLTGSPWPAKVVEATDAVRGGDLLCDPSAGAS